MADEELDMVLLFEEGRRTALCKSMKSARPPFYDSDTGINSLVGCAFWGSDECASSVH